MFAHPNFPDDGVRCDFLDERMAALFQPGLFRLCGRSRFGLDICFK